MCEQFVVGKQFRVINFGFDVTTPKHHKNLILNAGKLKASVHEFRRLFTTGT